MRSRDVFVEQANGWGLAGSDLLSDRFEQYVELLSGYEKANVIGTRDPDTLLLEHVLDSLSCFLFQPLWQAQTLADVGSGAGFPGIPIKVISPGLRATLIESTRKKADFLRQATRHLDLKEVCIRNQRVEEVAAEPDERGSYDIATARAVAPLSILAEYCVPLIREGGHVIAMKGAPSPTELVEGRRAAERIGARITELIAVPIHRELRARDRTLIILQKVRTTPDGYPRKAGAARKRPLGKT